MRFSAPPGDYDHVSVNPLPKLPFRKWVRSLKRRNSLSEGGETYTSDERCKYPEPSNPFRRVIHRRFKHRFSSSGSSLGFITAVQSATASLITASVAAPSRRRHGRSRAERSSRASLSTPRVSKDVGPLERAEEDLTATQRAFERRQILEELISTEENYIGDIRFLMNVSFGVLKRLGPANRIRPTSICLPLSLPCLSSYDHQLIEICTTFFNYTTKSWVTFTAWSPSPSILNLTTPCLAKAVAIDHGA